MKRITNPVRRGTLLALVLTSFAGLARSDERPARVPQIDPVSRHFMRPFVKDFVQPEQLGMTVERIQITNASGEELRGWYFPVKDSRQTILFCMGNTGNISIMPGYARLLTAGGFDVLLVDYQGFGESTGMATALSLVGDVSAAFDYLTTERKRPAAQIGVFGVSLGSVLALTVAAEKQAGAVAVEDVFVPDERIAAVQSQLPTDFASQFAIRTIRSTILPRVDPLKTVPKLSCPLLLMHGEYDQLLPPSGTIAVRKAATVPTRVWIMSGAGHAPETLEVNDREYASQLVDFFHDAFRGAVSSPTVSCTARADGDQFVATVNVATDRPSAIQIAMGSGTEKFVFVRRWVTDSATFEIPVPFEPQDVSAIDFRHYELTSQDEWAADLSPLSKCLADFRKLEVSYYDRLFSRKVDPPANVMELMQMRRDRPALGYAWLVEAMPRAESVHVQVRPRYARFLGQAADRMYRNGSDAAFEASQRLTSYLPDDLERCYQLDNAGFQIGFRDQRASECLCLLARKQASEGDLDDARRVLKLGLKLRPEYLPLISPESADAVSSEADIVRLLSEDP